MRPGDMVVMTHERGFFVVDSFNDVTGMAWVHRMYSEAGRKYKGRPVEIHQTSLIPAAHKLRQLHDKALNALRNVEHLISVVEQGI